MTKTTHATFGICSSFYLSTMIGVSPVYPVVVGVIASLLPDIDTGKSLINRLLIRIKMFQNRWMKLYYLALFIILFAVYQLTSNRVAGILSILCLLLVIGEHRTWFHSIFMMIPLVFIMNAFGLSTQLMAIGVLNYMLHLVLDMLNPGGVMFLYPISKNVFRFPIVFKSASVITRVLEYSADALLIYFTFRDAINLFL